MAGDLFQRLRAAAGAIWPAYTRHEFVLRLARGDLPEAAFRRYLLQDYLFLLHFARAWGLAIYKSENLTEMRRAQSLVAATLETEIGLHIEYCRGWGLSEAAMAQQPEALETIAYTRFVLDRGLAGDRLDLEVALAPCVVGYAEIAAERMAHSATRHDGNPYREWLDMYAGAEYQSLAREAAAALDEQFERRGGEGRFTALAASFATATRLEADVWRGRFVGDRGAARRRRVRGCRHHLAALRPRRGDRQKGRLLRRAGCARCGAGRRAPRHPALRARLRGAVSRSGDRGFCRKLSPRRDAGAVHPLQRAHQVPRPVRDRARAWRQRAGDRPLRAARAASGRAGAASRP